MLQHASIPERFSLAAFTNFILPVPGSVVWVGMAAALLSGSTFARNFSRATDPPGLIFIGPRGSGKTHLAIGTLRAVIERGTRGIFLDCGNLLEQVKEMFGSKGGQAQAFRAALDYDLVVLDDLGGQSSSEWVRDTLQSVIVHRYNERKATIVTTSLSLEELTEALGDRTASRLREMCAVVQLPPGTPDYRKKRGRK